LVKQGKPINLFVLSASFSFFLGNFFYLAILSHHLCIYGRALFHTRAFVVRGTLGTTHPNLCFLFA
jgi:hypothetical protein